MNVYLVRVTTDDQQHRIWAAATAREDAVGRVLDQVPEGWTASLLDEVTDAGRDAEKSPRNMTAGEIRELFS